MCCGKCGKLGGVLLLALGVVFLLKDLGVWNFWGISWWTIVFIFAGFAMIGCGSCPECQACCAPEKTVKPKRK